MRIAVLISLVVVASACATVPPPSAPVITLPDVPWEQKLAWMMRLEDQRILRDPNPPPAVVLAPAAKDRAAVLAPPPPSDLIRLLSDPEARVRRRAALAAGRVGLTEAVGPLGALLSDPEMEVRQIAAFALGLIGDQAARPALQGALKDPDGVVQGRAAEALGLIGVKDDAGVVAAMAQAHVRAGALNGIAADDLTYPLTPAAEAARLGLYALVRLGSYDALASVALDAAGQPVSSWWPVAYALQRLGDARAAPALQILLASGGRYSAAFAARGLGVVKAQSAVGALMQILQDGKAPAAVIVESLRALTAIGDPRAGAPLLALAIDNKADISLRVEALAGVGALKPPEAMDALLDLLSDRSPRIRAAAIRAVAGIDPSTVLTALSSLDTDPDWTVRAVQAATLGTLSAAEAAPLLTLMLEDTDQRVVPAVLNALVASRAPGAAEILIERLKADDFVVRAAAATGLGELKATSAVRPLADAYRAWLSDPPYTARAAALGALATIDPQAARPVLQDALADRDWAVRVRAAELLRAAAAASAPAASGAAPDSEGALRPAPAARAISDAEWSWMQAPPFSPHASIVTNRGTIELEMSVLDAPQTTANFIALARRGFFNGVPIHRVVPDFVVQDGDPRGDGEGGPGYSIRDEMNQRPYLRGTVGMALDWRDTGGSQFFITHSPQPHLDAKYTAFGQVVAGMEVVDQIQQGDVITSVTIRDGVDK